MEPTPLEQRFVDVYGEPVFQRIHQYIIDNNILDFYLKARNKPRDLFDFGFHYGIVEIVAFCYCVLKCPIDINEVIQGYYKSIDSTDEISKDMNAVPIQSSSGGQSSIIIGTSDRFTPMRRECIKFMIRMRNFSTYKMEKGKFIYSIVEKYIKLYQLLEVY